MTSYCMNSKQIVCMGGRLAAGLGRQLAGSGERHPASGLLEAQESCEPFMPPLSGDLHLPWLS